MPLTRVVALLALAAPAAAADWPSFRGPRATGVADGADLPVTWDVKTGANVRWKAAVPGLGHSSPIVWGDRIFLTSAVTREPPRVVLGDEGGIRLDDDAQPQSWRLFCLSTRDGRLLWEREVDAGPARAKRHVKASQANATPATDGRTVVAVFGSGTLAAFDVAGQPRWRADLGVLNPGLYRDATSEWGHASSPIVFENLAIVQVDRHRDSFLAAFDLSTGKRVWTVQRDERPVWATPTLHGAGADAELIVVGGNYQRAYDPRTGRERWRFKDEAEVKTPTPFVSNDLIVFAGGYRGRPIYALRPGGRGDLSVPETAATGTHLRWRTEAGGPYTSTPVAYGGLLFGVRDEGILFAYDMATGERVFRERTNATHAASLVAGAGHVYAAAETGEVLVLRAGRAFALAARNDMGESCMATPAIADGVLYVRTRGHLYALAAEAAAKPGGPLGKGR
jgi:outer membrane protein assembly factor BamB